MFVLLMSVVAALEVARRVPVLKAFRNLAGISARTPRIWAYRRGLEERKERATRMLSVRMFSCSASALWMLALVVSPVALVLLVDPWLTLGAWEALLNWRDRLIIGVLSLAYGLARIQVSRHLQRP